MYQQAQLNQTLLVCVFNTVFFFSLSLKKKISATFLLYLFEEWIRAKNWPAIATRALRKVQVAQSLQLDYVSCVIKSHGQKY